MNPQSRFAKQLAIIVLSLLGMANVHAAVNINYVVNNHLGAPVLLVDQNQHVVWQAEYDEFGKATILVEEVEFNVRFPGQYYDKETGLTYNYYRDYNQDLGRYVQSDPIGLAGGINTYGYAYQNPVMNIDPDGRFVWFGIPVAYWMVGGGSIAAGGVCVSTNCGQKFVDAMSDWWNGGAADQPAPYDHYTENEALNFMPDPFGGDEACRKLANAIKVLRAQIEWRKTDLNPLSFDYQSHVTRILILKTALDKLEKAYENICGGNCNV